MADRHVAGSSRGARGARLARHDLADRGRRRRAPPIERFVVFEALIGEGAPVATSWFADRQIGPTLLQFGTAEQQRPLAARHHRRHLGVVHRHERARRRQRRGVVAHPRRAPHDGATTWVVNGRRSGPSGAARRRLVLPHRPHRSRRPAARRPVGARRRHAIARHHGPPDRRHDRQRATSARSYFNDVRVPGANLVGEQNGSFRQVMRQMEHERGGIDRLVSNRRLYLDAVARSPTSTDPLVRQELAAIETGYRIGRLLVLREVLGQAPAGFSAATKTFCTEFEQRVAEFCARVAGPDGDAVEPRVAATSATPRRTRSWAAPHRSCATSSASACSVSPANRGLRPDRDTFVEVRPGSHRLGTAHRTLLQLTSFEPAPRTSPSTSRSRLQPPASRCSMPLHRCCQRATPGSGLKPCSRKWSSPPGRRMRRTSPNAREASGIVHNVNVDSAASTDASASGISWPSRPMNSTGTEAAAIRGAASFRPTPEGSTARTRSTSSGYSSTFSPDPKPISSTTPRRPSTALPMPADFLVAEHDVSHPRHDMIAPETHGAECIGRATGCVARRSRAEWVRAPLRQTRVDEQLPRQERGPLRVGRRTVLLVEARGVTTLVAVRRQLGDESGRARRGERRHDTVAIVDGRVVLGVDERCR